MVEHRMVPESVALVYRVVGGTHVFSSQGIVGLVHVGSHDREKAFHGVMDALNKHVPAAYGTPAKYTCTISYEDFSRHVDSDNDIAGNFIELRLAHAA